MLERSQPIVSSYVPSTSRCGISQLRYVGDGKVEFLFTFTVREIWGRFIEEAEHVEGGKASPVTS